MPLRYSPRNNRIAADVIPFFDHDEYHLFYLKGYSEGSGWSRSQTPWGHIRSRDLLQWEELDNALETGLQSEHDGGACFTGSVIRNGEEVHIFYTGFNPGYPLGREQIMHAVSSDGIHFRKNASNPILILDSPYYGSGEDFRDPYVFWHEDEQLYWMLFTAGEGQPLCGIRRGVIGLAKSVNLSDWEFSLPIYAPKDYPSLECPDLFRIGDKWYLLFSQYGRTEYRIGDTAYGPWRKPRYPHFDIGDYYFYAAKTLYDGQRRLLVGWCGDLAGGKDARHALWGGAIVTPREIIAGDDGQLSLHCPTEYLRIFNSVVKIQYNDFILVAGEWHVGNDGLTTPMAQGMSACLCESKSTDIMMRGIIEPLQSRGNVGVVLRSAPDLSSHYLLNFDLDSGHLTLERYSTVYAFHGPTLEGERILASRSFPLREGEPIAFTIFLKDNILELFAQGITATAPLQDLQGHHFGFMTRDANVRFSEIEIKE